MLNLCTQENKKLSDAYCLCEYGTTKLHEQTTVVFCKSYQRTCRRLLCASLPAFFFFFFFSLSHNSLIIACSSLAPSVVTLSYNRTQQQLLETLWYQIRQIVKKTSQVVETKICCDSWKWICFHRLSKALHNLRPVISWYIFINAHTQQLNRL